MKFRAGFGGSLLGLAALFLIATSGAQTPEGQSSRFAGVPDEGPGYQIIDNSALLDRGGSFLKADPTTRTHTSPQAVLSHPGAGPGITMVSIGFFPTMAPASFIGNFYTAPGDFPTSYYPFFVTGAFAFATGPPTAIRLGAGVAPGPFPVGTQMWAAFFTAAQAGPPAMTSGIFGGTGIFPHSPPSGGVITGQGVACGMFSIPGPGPGVGALAFPPMPRPSRVSFAGPPDGHHGHAYDCDFRSSERGRCRLLHQWCDRTGRAPVVFGRVVRSHHCGRQRGDRVVRPPQTAMKVR